MKEEFEICVPCHFGTESVCKREIQALGYPISCVEDGRVTFLGDWEAVVEANLCLCTGERVLRKLASFTAKSFEEFFQGIKGIPWEDFLEADSKFWVTKATSVKSKLAAVPTLQSVAKKAMVERMREATGQTEFCERGKEFPVRIFLMKDVCVVTLDTTGVPLHKRGYRRLSSAAPISETLAASMLMLTPWRRDRILLDPFCGSGTIAIEAAMRAAHIAPGLHREFGAQQWAHLISPALWESAKRRLAAQVDLSVTTDIQGYDIDEDMIAIAKKNAAAAGVEGLIHFQRRDVGQTSHRKKYGFLVTNPPYGERIGDAGELPQLYEKLGEAYRRLDAWSMYVITAYRDAERYLGRKADKNRKIYNGMMKTYFYQYRGEKPPMRDKG